MAYIGTVAVIKRGDSRLKIIALITRGKAECNKCNSTTTDVVLLYCTTKEKYALLRNQYLLE